MERTTVLLVVAIMIWCVVAGGAGAAMAWFAPENDARSTLAFGCGLIVGGVAAIYLERVYHAVMVVDN